ncbi:MAG: DUF6338 family protein [Achromobacter sp.]
MSDLPAAIAEFMGAASPGAIAMVIYYQKVPWARPDKLDQAVYGIIGTGTVALIAALIESFLRWAISIFDFETPNLDLLQSTLRIAAGVGLGLIWARYFDGKLHRQLAADSKESISSGPTAWHHAFRLMGSFVILHLQDGRRLQGWPKGWPGEATKGHFLLTHTRWLDDSAHPEKVGSGYAVLMPVDKVSWIQFIPDSAALNPLGHAQATHASSSITAQECAHHC